MQKKYYRAKEVSIYLGVGVSTVWRYAKNGLLHPKKISTHVTVFDIQEVKALCSANNAG